MDAKKIRRNHFLVRWSCGGVIGGGTFGILLLAPSRVISEVIIN